MLSAPAAGALAQAAGPLVFDPSVADQGTALVVAVDGTMLASDGQSPSSITFALPRGMRVDTASRKQLCGRDAAARAACPQDSRIGFGRYVLNVGGFLVPGGQTQLSWSIDAYLGRPVQHGDAASVVLSATLVEPAIGTSVPRAVTTTGRLVRRASGAYGLELRFPQPPAQLAVAAPITATPARLELALSAVRRVRQNFVHRIKVRTPSGYAIQKIRDHRLVGHDLLRAPPRCGGSWPYALRIGFPSGVRRTTGRVACAKTLIGAPSAARRRA